MYYCSWHCFILLLSAAVQVYNLLTLWKCRRYSTACVCIFPGNIHVYTNQGASYSQFYQPRRRRAYERREEVVEENQSQVSDSQNIKTNLC